VRALTAAKEAGNAAFKAQRWGDAHASYSAAIARRSQQPALEGNAAFFAQCFSNRCAWVAMLVPAQAGKTMQGEGFVSISVYQEHSSVLLGAGRRCA
jgi:hypothetical protein